MMTSAIVIAVLVIAALAATLLLLRSERAPVSETAQPVDLEAFRNLMSTEDEEFLRERLAPDEFRRLYRKRMAVAASYVRAMNEYAAYLVITNEPHVQSAETTIAETARQMVEEGIALRWSATVALIGVRLRWVFPGLQPRLEQFAREYERFLQSAQLLQRTVQSRQNA